MFRNIDDKILTFPFISGEEVGTTQATTDTENHAIERRKHTVLVCTTSDTECTAVYSRVSASFIRSPTDLSYNELSVSIKKLNTANSGNFDFGVKSAVNVPPNVMKKYREKIVKVFNTLIKMYNIDSQFQRTVFFWKKKKSRCQYQL